MERRQAHLGAPDQRTVRQFDPRLPRLAPPIILVPLISGLGLRSCLSATHSASYGRIIRPCVKEGHNASWRADRRMGSLGFHRCQRNACYDRRCDRLPVPCSSEDMDFGSDRDRGGNDGDRRLRGPVALTRHLTDVMRPAMSQFAAVSRRTGRQFPAIQLCACRGPMNTEAASPDLAAQSRAGLLHTQLKKGAPEGTPYAMAVRLRLRSCGSRIGPLWRGRGSRS